MAITTITGNSDVDYLVKDFDSTVDALITFANTQFGPGTAANRVWTNFNQDSFSRNWLEILAYTSDILSFYFDQQATQSYLQTATIRSAIRDISKQFGFQPATATSASGNVTFTFTGAGTLARGFRVSSSSGVPYYLTNPVTATAAGQFTGSVLQGVRNTDTRTSSGLQNEEFNLSGTNVIVDNTSSNALDRSPIVTVNGNTYTLVESFIRSNGTDTPAVTDALGNVIGGGGRVFQLLERADGTPFVRFGDGVFGRKLVPGETVTVTYRSGGGTQGNAPAGTITTLTDSASFVTAVTNTSDFSGGADEQSIEQLRDLIPASLRTLERAVARTDYSDLIIANFNEVSAASTEVNNTDAGIDLNIYVVPQGNTITKISENNTLLNNLNTFIDRRKTVTIQFQILDAFGIQVVVGLEIFISGTASRTTVTETVQTALVEFFDLQSGGVDESGIDFAQEILLKDISNLLQNIEGIERFEIKRLTYKPRIATDVQGLTTAYNTSEVDTFPNVEELEWLVAASGQQTETAGSVLFENSTPTPFTYDSVTGIIQYVNPVLLEGIAPGDLFRNGPGQKETAEIQTVGDGSGALEVVKITTVADQQGIQEEFTVETRADVGGDLFGTFFVMFDLAGSVGVWFSDGTTPQPSMGTNRDIEVIISQNDNASDVAAALRIALDADSQFSATVSGTAQVTEITTDDPSILSDGQYFLINAANDAPQYYAWFDTSGSASDPNVSGRLGIKIDSSGTTTPTNLATQIATVLDGVSSFSATSSGNVVTVTNTDNGPATPATDVTLPGSFLVATPTLGTNANVVTVLNAVKLDVPDTVDGSVPTDFILNTTIQGISPDTLGSAYFDIADDAGPVRVWFDLDNSSTAPSVPSGGRLLEVNIAANDTANDVALSLQSVLDADTEYSATISSNEVTLTNIVVGERDGPTDGVPPTGFTLDTEVEGAEPQTIDGTYFVVSDTNGGIGFWFDVDDSGTTQPATGQVRNVEINTITSGMTDIQVAQEVELALSSSGAYSSELAEISQVETIADVSQSLNNKYFLISAANDSTLYYVWYDVDGNGTDPASVTTPPAELSGRTGIQVAITEDALASAVASATASAIDAFSDFSALASSNEVTITNVDGGAATNISDGASPQDTGFGLSVFRQGATFNVSRIDNTITVEALQEAEIQDATAGTSGFTIEVTQQGVANDTDFIVRGIDIPNSRVFLDEGLPINPVEAANAGGSIRNGATTFDSFKVFRKINATATNLSIDSITDSSLDLSQQTGTATALGARVLIDNNQVFVPNEFATGNYYLIDGSGNVWEIIENTSNTITTSITAVNDAAISTVSGGDYKIVTKLVGSQIVFNGSIFNVQYNTENTIISPAAQFTQIGTIGDSFQISREQSNQGKLGTPADLISFNNATGQIRLNGSPDLTGISSGDTLIDAEGQTFSIIGVDNRNLPIVEYVDSNANDDLLLTGSGDQQQLAQGFQVAETDTYSVVSASLKREGNIIGNLTARIVGSDTNGLPDVTDLIAISNSVLVTNISDSVFEKVVFNFTSPPTLNAGQQYHLIISGDVAYAASQQNNISSFNNAGPETYTYLSASGTIQYSGTVSLTNVQEGHFLMDGSGEFFSIVSVNDAANTINIAPGSAVDDTTNSSTVGGSSFNGGSVFIKDNVRVQVDNLAPTFSSGELSRFDGVEWSNSSQGGNQFSTEHDLIFTVEGPKSIKIDSNLTPVLGAGATVSTRYYDDESQVSFIIGISEGIITSASDVNAAGRGTVGALPNSPTDQFIFRTSRPSDDIVNLRLNEIPQLNPEDINISIFGGVQ